MSATTMLFPYDPQGNPTSRLRLEYDADRGLAVLSDEDTLPEQVDNPHARRVDVRDSVDLTTAMVRWLSKVMPDLADEMEAHDRAVVERVKAIRRAMGLPEGEGEP